MRNLSHGNVSFVALVLGLILSGCGGGGSQPTGGSGNPVPSLSSVAPPSITAGSAAVNLTLSVLDHPCASAHVDPPHTERNSLMKAKILVIVATSLFALSAFAVTSAEKCRADCCAGNSCGHLSCCPACCD